MNGWGIRDERMDNPAPLPSFPRKRESRIVLPKTGLLPIGPFGIPAYAGMTVERGGKDGGGGGKDTPKVSEDNRPPNDCAG